MWWVLISADTYVSIIWSKYRILSLSHMSHYVRYSQSRPIIVLRKYFSDFCNYNFSFLKFTYVNNIICQFHSSSSHNFCYGKEWYQSSACPASGSYSLGGNVLCPDYLRIRYQVTRGSIPIPLEPELFKQLILNLLILSILPHPFLPMKTRIKAFARSFPCLVSTVSNNFFPSRRKEACSRTHTWLKQILDVF